MFIALKLVFTVLYIVVIFFCYKHIHKIAKKTMFSYEIISSLGIIIFLLGLILHNLFGIYDVLIQPELTEGFRAFYRDFSRSSANFSYLMFPFIILFSVFLSISNIILLFKEGRSLTNFLGFFLGIVLILASLSLNGLYDFIEKFINVKSYFGVHLAIALESFISVGLAYFECMMFATIYAAIKCAHHKIKQSQDYVIVLGCYVLPDGHPGGVLKKRVDAALAFARTQKHDYKLAPVTIFSGGQGKNEPISEAKSMQNYSFSKRYKEKTILEDKSKTTRQNFLFSKQFIKDDSKVAFATTDFHVFRSGVIASKSGYRNIESISAKSPWYFYNNALIREFVANIYSERKMHLFNILLINTVSMSLIILSYVFHIM